MQEEREEAVSASVYKINQGKRRKMTNDLRERIVNYFPEFITYRDE